MTAGYTDYEIFGRWTTKNIYFVTRMKDNALYRVNRGKKVPQNRNILEIEIIELSGLGTYEKCPHKLRRIKFENPENGDILIFLTNHMTFGASTVTAIYKDRWQIEAFFKALKQT
jgi:IS4 transposase